MSDPTSHSVVLRYDTQNGRRLDHTTWRESPAPISTDSAVQRKALERQSIKDDIAEFRRRKGRIEVLPGVGAKR